MASPALLARPYAEAAFAFACESNRVREWRDALSQMADVVSRPDFDVILHHPKAGREAVCSVLLAALEDALDSHQQNFAAVLAENRRAPLAPAIFRRFEELRREAEKISRAVVQTAFPISEDSLAEIADALSRRLGRKVEAQATVDSSLIGGVRIRVGDDVIDGSVRGNLERLASALKN